MRTKGPRSRLDHTPDFFSQSLRSVPPVMEIESTRCQLVFERTTGVPMRLYTGIIYFYLDGTITNAVVTVPPYFSDSTVSGYQGCNVLFTVNESRVAVISYDLSEKVVGERNLIFDLSGGIVSVTHLAIEEGIVEVEITPRDTHLGDEDFDRGLVNHFVQESTRNTQG